MFLGTSGKEKLLERATAKAARRRAEVEDCKSNVFTEIIFLDFSQDIFVTMSDSHQFNLQPGLEPGV